LSLFSHSIQANFDLLSHVVVNSFTLALNEGNVSLKLTWASALWVRFLSMHHTEDISSAVPADVPWGFPSSQTRVFWDYKHNRIEFSSQKNYLGL